MLFFGVGTLHGTNISPLKAAGPPMVFLLGERCDCSQKGTCNDSYKKGNMDVSKNSGTPKSSIVIRLSIINHPFWGTSILGNTHILKRKDRLPTTIFQRRNVELQGDKFHG